MCVQESNSLELSINAVQTKITEALLLNHTVETGKLFKWMSSLTLDFVDFISGMFYWALI